MRRRNNTCNAKVRANPPRVVKVPGSHAHAPSAFQRIRITLKGISAMIIAPKQAKKKPTQRLVGASFGAQVSAFAGALSVMIFLSCVRCFPMSGTFSTV